VTCAWFGHVTADALQMLKVMRSEVTVKTQKRNPSRAKYVILWRVSHASLRIIAQEHVRLLMTRGHVDDSLLASSGS